MAFNAKRNQNLKFLKIEEMETRMLLSGSVVDDAPEASHESVSSLPSLIHHEALPDFAAYPTLVSVQSGDWNDTNTWGGRLPSGDDIVVIDAEHEVNLSADDAALVQTVGVSGKLTIEGELKTGTLLIYHTGQTEMQAGSVLTIRDVEIDRADDPLQWGTGVIVLGHFSTHGTAKTEAVRASGHILNGSASIQLESVPADWEVGDQILIPATDQTANDDSIVSAANEVRRITGLNGNRISLDIPLTSDHLGVENSEADVFRYAHVMNITRDVLIQSENPEGTRGHLAYTHGGYVDIAFTRFEGFGRTKSTELNDSTVLGHDGAILHEGTNQAARYVIHAHHTVGLAGGREDSPYQSTIVGNVITDSPSWGIVLHGSDDILVDRNIVFGTSGAGIVTEDGSELRNVISNNVLVGIQGATQGNVAKRGGVVRRNLELNDGTVEKVVSFGLLGDGIWTTHAGNTVIDNVVYSSQGFGLNANAYYIGKFDVRLERGSSLTTNVNVVQPSLAGAEISGMEVVSSRGLFWSTHTTHKQKEAEVRYSDFLGWNLSGDSAIKAYHESGIRLDDFTVVFNAAASAKRQTEIESVAGRDNFGFHGNGSYPLANSVIHNLRVYGATIGVSTPAAVAHKRTSNYLLFDGGVLQNFTNILGNSVKKDVEIEFRNYEFRDLINPNTGEHRDVTMEFQFDARRHMRGAEGKIVVNGERQWFDVQQESFVLPEFSGSNLEKAIENFGFDPSGLSALEFSQQAGFILGGGFRPSLWQQIYDETGTVLG